MNETVRLYDLAASPNNMKVRIALSYKGIAYEKVPVNARDRSEVVKISGQPLTPVITHGERVVFDSAAILRYLEANFRDTPPLFSTDAQTMRAIERWEALARTELAQPVSICFGQFFASERDPAESERASKMLGELSGRIEEALANGPWLVGEQMSAADVAAAPAVFYGMVPDAAAAASPIAQFFREHLKLGEGRERTREWVGRVMAHDR
jgi:glutathione S-transferase